MIWVLAVAVIVFVAVAVHVALVAKRAPEIPPTALPAIVLGARVFPDGTASDALRDRVRTGVELITSGHATRLVLTGGTPDGRPTEAAVMKSLAGLDEGLLQLEAASRSTFENARFCAALMPERAVILVTCDFHMARAAAYFRSEGFTVWPVASKRSLRPVDRWRLTLKEAVALLSRPRLLWALRPPPNV